MNPFERLLVIQEQLAQAQVQLGGQIGGIVPEFGLENPLSRLEIAFFKLNERHFLVHKSVVFRNWFFGRVHAHWEPGPELIRWTVRISSAANDALIDQHRCGDKNTFEENFLNMEYSGDTPGSARPQIGATLSEPIPGTLCGGIMPGLTVRADRKPRSWTTTECRPVVSAVATRMPGESILLGKRRVRG